MTGDLHLRLAEPGDTETLTRMLRHSLGPAMTAELWRWKHLESPFGPSPALLAVDGAGIAAVRPFMRWEWVCGSRTVWAVRAVDTATRPDWRRRGLFTRLTERLAKHVQAEGAAFVFNTPNRKSLPGYLSLGWSQVTRIPLWFAPRPLRMLGHALRGRRQTEEATRLPTSSRPVSEFLDSPDLHHFMETMASRRYARYSTNRDLRYLRWRYGEAPSHHYLASWTLRGDHGAALIFRAQPRGQFSEILVSEILTSDRGALDDAVLLLEDLRRSMRTDYAAAVAPDDSVAGEALRRAGFFLARGMGPRLTVRRLAMAPELPDPLRWRSWCCSLGDLEVF